MVVAAHRDPDQPNALAKCMSNDWGKIQCTKKSLVMTRRNHDYICIFSHAITTNKYYLLFSVSWLLVSALSPFHSKRRGWLKLGMYSYCKVRWWISMEYEWHSKDWSQLLMACKGKLEWPPTARLLRGHWSAWYREPPLMPTDFSLHQIVSRKLK